MMNENDDWKRYLDGEGNDEFWPDYLSGDSGLFFQTPGSVGVVPHGTLSAKIPNPVFAVKPIAGVANLFKCHRPGYPSQWVSEKTLKKCIRKIKKAGIKAIFVHLTDGEYLKYYGFNLIEHYREQGFTVHAFPIPDFGVPRIEFAYDFVTQMERHLKSKEKVLVHCSAGIGRTGLAINCLITKKNQSKKARKIDLLGSETGGQRNFLVTFRVHLSKQKKKKKGK